MVSLFKSSRFILIVGLLALFAQSALAHTYLSSLYLNNQALDEGDCVRPHPSTAYDSPIPLVTSPEMTCGWLPQAANPANRKCPINAGDTIGVQWHHQSSSPSDDIIDPTHEGPIIMYLAKSDTGAGNVWFKIYEDGFKDGKWAVDRLLANKGRVDFKIPSDIAPGNYLLRAELIALHGAYALNGVQPYVGCAELTIAGSGKANPAGVAFPGYYTNTDPGMLFSMYQAFTQYIIPGPALYGSGSSSSSSGSSSGSSSSTPSSSSSSSGAPTTAPPSAPTTRPTPSIGNIQIGLNGGSGVWWVGVVVSGGGETTVKVELTDSGSVKSWVALKDESYAYTYSANPQLVTPLSIRLTSSSGKQVVLTNVFTSFSTGGRLIDSGKSYSSSSTNPTSAPATQAPTTKPSTPAPTTKPSTPAPTTKPSTPAPTTKPSTPAPTNPPSSGANAKVTVYSSATSWWFALTVSGAASVNKVEIKDSGVVTNFVAMTANSWGQDTVYTYSPNGVELKTPISIRVTNAAGKTATATISSFTGNAVFETNGSL